MVGILAYGSLINDPGEELKKVIVGRIPCQTPFNVEYARLSVTRDNAPTLIPTSEGGLVSAVTLVQASGNGTGGAHVEVKKADGAKCERCWNYSIRVGEDAKYPTVCERCSPVLRELESS